MIDSFDYYRMTGTVFKLNLVPIPTPYTINNLAPYQTGYLVLTAVRRGQTRFIWCCIHIYIRPNHEEQKWAMANIF